MKTPVFAFIFSLLLEVISLEIQAQPLTGVKTIPGDYPTLALAIQQLNLYGTTAPGVTFNIASGYMETGLNLTINTSTSSETSPVVFQKAPGAAVNPKIYGAAGGTYSKDGIIIIAGSDYITFDGIDLQAADNTIDWGYALVKKSSTAPFDGCQHVVIRNCSIQMNRGNDNACGIYSGNHTAASTSPLTISSTTDACSNCSIYGNYIRNVFYGISFTGYNAPSPYTLVDQNNRIGTDGGNTINNCGGGYNPVIIYGAYQNGIDISNNIITSGAITTAPSISVTGIGLYYGNNSSATVSNNSVSISFSGGGSQTLYGIYLYGAQGTSNTLNINNNSVDHCTIGATGSPSFYGIHNELAYQGPNALNMNNNSVHDITIPGGGSVFAMNGGTAANLQMNGNTIYNFTLTGSAAATLFKAGTGIVVHHGNVIHDVTVASGSNAIYGMYNYASPTNETYYNNQVYNLVHNGSGPVYGMYYNTASGTRQSFSNTIHALSSGGGAVYGMYYGSSTPAIYKNQVYDLFSGTATGQVFGMYLYSGSNVTIYNNFISDLRTPASTLTNAISGIYMNSSGNNYLWYNTIHINASSSSATTFGTAGINLSGNTSSIELKNNVIVNTSVPVFSTGPAYTTALQRAITSLYSYATSSNNNCFYAGTPGPNNLIYYDGTNGDQSISLFKSRVTPRETTSVSEVPPFVNPANHDLHIQPGAVTSLESGAVKIVTPTAIPFDYDGDIRFGETGYSGTGTAPDIGADEGTFTRLPDMSYLSSATEQVTGNTFSGTANQQIIRIRITVAGGAAPMSVTQFMVNAAGTTTITDINASVSKIVYTGNSSYFGPGLQFGTAIPTLASFSITGNQTLAPGDNYFWLVYNIIQTATTGHIIDGQCVSLTLNNIQQVPSVTAPSGNMTILGPMAGTYLVGAGNVEPNFVTLTEAINHINHRGTLGPVIFRLTNPASTPYNQANGEVFPVTVDVIPLASAVNTVTIQPATGVSPVISGSSATVILKFNGTDYFTINGSNSGGTTRDLLIENVSTSHNTGCIQLSSPGTGAGCTYDTFKNCMIRSGTTGGISAYTYAVSVGSTLGSSGADNRFLTFHNNEITRAYYGLYFGGTSSVADNISVTGNTIGSDNPAQYIGYIGLFTNNLQGTVAGNTIKGVSSSSVTTRAIYIGPGTRNTEVLRNDIHTINGVPGSGFCGVGIEIDLASAGNNITIANNLIYDISGDGTSNLYSYGTCGIKISGISTNVKVYHNTINISGQISRAAATADASAAIFIWLSATQIDIRNNIFANSLENVTGVAKAYAVYTSAPASAFSALDYNDYFASGREAVLGYFNSTDHASLSAWQTATSRDVHSISVDPDFNSDFVPVSYPGSAVLDNCPLLSITDDFAGNPRNDPASMGAFESGNDLTSPVISYTPLHNTHLLTARTLIASIADQYSTVPHSGSGLPRMYWRINNNPWSIATGAWVSGNNYRFTFGNSVAMGDQVSYFIVCQDEMATPNVGSAPSAGASGFSASPPACTIAPASPSSYSIVGSLSGVKTIPGDYPSLTGANGFFADMNTKTLSGNLTVKIIANLTEDGAIALNEVNTEDPAYKLTIISSGDYHTVSGSYSGSLIRLNGVDNLTLNGKGKLMIINNQSYPSIVLSLSGGCNNNTIDSCNFSGGTMFWHPDNIGISLSGQGNNNRFRFDTISRTNCAISLNGGYWGNGTGNVLYKNVIGSATSTKYVGNYGIYLKYQDQALVSGNQVFNMIFNGSPVAINLEGVTNSIVEKNDIHDIVYNGTSYGGASGITLLSLNLSPGVTIRNNLIRHISGMGSSPNTSDQNSIPAGIKLFGNATSGISIYHNSVYLTRDVSYGLFYNNEWFTALEIGAGVSGVILKNNILQNSVGEWNGQNITSWAYSIYTKGTSSPFASINNNIYFTSNADNNFVGLKGTSVPPVNNMNLADWKSFTTQDGQSLNTDPLFSSVSNLTPQSGSPAIAGGLPLPGVVDDDFHGNARGTSTTIGAIEMNPYSPFPVVYPVTGAGAFCQNEGGKAVGMTNSQADAVYQLYRNGNPYGALVMGTGTSFTFPGLQPAGTYSVMASNSNGSIAMANNVVVQMYPSPVPTITGVRSACAGTEGVPYTTEASMTNYSWIVTGGDIATGAGTHAITVNWGQAGTGNVSVNYANSNQCTALNLSQAIVAIFNPPASAQTLSNVTVQNGEVICKDALQTISVGGGGSNYLISAGANVHLVAGMKIRLLPGVKVLPGGALHAYIEKECNYCNVLKTSEPELPAEYEADPVPMAGPSGKEEIKIYPNPTSGWVNIIWNNDTATDDGTLFIYGLQGQLIHRQAITNSLTVRFDLSGIPDGLYLVRISAGNGEWVRRVIKAEK